MIDSIKITPYNIPGPEHWLAVAIDTAMTSISRQAALTPMRIFLFSWILLNMLLGVMVVVGVVVGCGGDKGPSEASLDDIINWLLVPRTFKINQFPKFRTFWKCCWYQPCLISTCRERVCSTLTRPCDGLSIYIILSKDAAGLETSQMSQ